MDRARRSELGSILDSNGPIPDRLSPLKTDSGQTSFFVGLSLCSREVRGIVENHQLIGLEGQDSKRTTIAIGELDFAAPSW